MLNPRTLAFLFTFFAVQTQCPKHRRVVTGEKDGVLRSCRMLLPAPGRYTKGIVWCPVETLAVDDAVATALDNVMNVVPQRPPRFCPPAGFDQLHGRIDRRHHRTSGEPVFKSDRTAVR